MNEPDSNGDNPNLEDRTDDANVSALWDQSAESTDPDESDESGEPGGGNEAIVDDDGSVTNDYLDRSTDVEGKIAALERENDDLRADYARARKATHRKTALVLAVIGVLAVLGGVAYPDVRATLFVTGSVGLFGGVLTWYLTPERVVPIGVSESAYDATASTLRGMRDELGLQSLTVYVPVDDQIRGFIPRYRAFELPEHPRRVFVTDDGLSRGVSFSPTGRRLTGEFDRMRRTEPPATAVDAVEQLGETLVEHFEIAGTVTVEEDVDTSDLRVSVRDAAFGSLSRVDHPVVSTLACGVAKATEKPVAVEPIDDETVVFDVEPEKSAESSENM